MLTRIALLCGIILLPMTAVVAAEEQESTLKVGFTTIKSKQNTDAEKDVALSFSPSEARPKPASKTPVLSTGLYPLVEETGYVSNAHTLQMAWKQITYSLLDGVSIGTQPALFIFRTPNFYVKARLYQDQRNAVAANIGVNVLLKNSGDFFTTFYASPIYNPNSSVYVIPLSLSHSFRLNRYITLHQTVSDINIMAERDFEETATFGYSAMAELKARQHHSVFVHAGRIGVINLAYQYAGISYRYSGSSFFTQVGYFYRVQEEGVQSLPLFDIGFLL